MWGLSGVACKHARQWTLINKSSHPYEPESKHAEHDDRADSAEGDAHRLTIGQHSSVSTSAGQTH